MLLAAALLVMLASPDRAFPYSLTFYSFFDQGSAALTDRARGVAAAAAELWHRQRDGSAHDYLDPGGPPLPATDPNLDVYGYAQDAAGDNEALSRPRAEAVAAELRRRGVPAARITATGMAAREPLVPNSPLDSQNRRAWIVFR